MYLYNARYRMDVIAPVTNATSSNRKAAPTVAIATITRQSGSTSNTYKNTIYPPTYKGVIGKYDYQSPSVEVDEMIKNAIKNKKHLVISSLGYKYGIKEIKGKIVTLKSGLKNPKGLPYKKLLVIIPENKATEPTEGVKTSHQPKKTNPIKKAIKNATQANVDLSNEYKTLLKQEKANLEALISDKKVSKIFSFDNGHGIKPVFEKTAKEFVAKITKHLKNFGFNKKVYNLVDQNVNHPLKPAVMGFTKNIFIQGYEGKGGFNLYAGGVYKTADAAIKEYETKAEKYIKEIEKNSVVQDAVTSLKQQFKQYRIKEDFTILDEYIKKLSISRTVPVKNSATAQVLIKKYIESSRTDVHHFKSGNFITGSGSYATCVKYTRGKKIGSFNYFVTIGLMFDKKQKNLKH